MSANEIEPDGFGPRYDTLVSRRASREPLAYIVGRREFWGLRFEVAPGVLIPRPETELLVEAGLEMFPAADGQIRIADVGTGSGCIGVALAHERPGAAVLATDISDAAVEIARRNAARHGVADRMQVIRADLLEGVDGPFDLIVANPPYIRDYERALLQREVREHEPSVALFGGLKGLDLIARLVVQASTRLVPGGYLIFEFGFGQDVEVEDFIDATSTLRFVELRRDLQGIARIAVARKQ
jgi:release factor glutamine methyltransferase